MHYRKLKFQCLTLLLKKYHLLDYCFWDSIDVETSDMGWFSSNYPVIIVQKDQGNEGDPGYLREISQV